MPDTAISTVRPRPNTPAHPQWSPLLERWPQLASNMARTDVILTRENYDQLATVHHDVTASYPYVRDFDRFRKRDYWEPAERFVGGDCEDLALRMWLQLLEWGWESSSFALGLCNAPQGSHAVLLVFTTEGLIGLDNLAWKPAGLPDLQYKWLYRSEPNNEPWVSMWYGDGLDEARVLHPKIRRLNRRPLKRST